MQQKNMAEKMVAAGDTFSSLRPNDAAPASTATTAPAAPATKPKKAKK